jgi:hypothetical protein
MKTTKTYSIEESLYNAFDSLANQKNINKSSFFEDYIKKFLKDNDLEFVDKVYALKTDNTKMVTVLTQDTTTYTLSDGSKINKILFMTLFEEFIGVDPVGFFSKTDNILKNIVDKIKSIDESKVPGGPIDELRNSRKFNVPFSDEEDISAHYGSDVSVKINQQWDLDKSTEEESKKQERKDNDVIYKIHCDDLDKIEADYNSGNYALKNSTEMCEDIISLMSLNFEYGEKEYFLRDSLIQKIKYLKNSMKISNNIY